VSEVQQQAGPPAQPAQSAQPNQPLPPESQPQPQQPSTTRRGPRDRDVLILMAAVVVVVLVANLISAVVPGMDQALAVLPVLVILLIIGTIYILFRALRPRS
jgi:hypothetical protein